MELSTATRHPGGHPFVRLMLGREAVLLTPDECRSLASMMADFAATAEVEAALVRVLDTEHVEDLTPSDVIGLITKARRELRDPGVH